MDETAFLDCVTPLNDGKTNREIFAEERDRIVKTLHDPVAMKDYRNEGLYWSLAAMNDILDGRETNQFMLETYLADILTHKVMANVYEKAETKEKAQLN